MTTIRPRDLLSESLLDRLDRTADQADASPGELIGDIALLAEAGYLNVALPAELGGLGCTLRQAACGQRRLARRAPRTALAVSAHLYWTGAAADACRAGDESVRWILLEASRGALLAGGHSGDAGETGGDLKFADPRSRCERTGQSYQFADDSVLSTVTPGWDWIAVHGVHQAAAARSVIAFAGRGTGSTPAFRVARTVVAGTPGDVFTASALTWGHSILASVQYSDARRAFDAALTAYAEAAAAAISGAAGPSAPRVSGTAGDPASAAPGPGAPAFGDPASAAPASGAPAGVSSGTPRPSVPAGKPADGHWPVAEAGARLDAMKARIAEVTHPRRLVQTPGCDLGGQHLIGLYAMRHEIAAGAARVHDLISQITGTPAPARPLVR